MADSILSESVVYCTALYLAVQNGHRDVVEYITGLPVRPGASGLFEFTAVYFAAKHGDLSLFKSIFQCSAKCDEMSKANCSLQKGIKIDLDYDCGGFECIKDEIKIEYDAELENTEAEQENIGRSIQERTMEAEFDECRSSIHSELDLDYDYDSGAVDGIKVEHDGNVIEMEHGADVGSPAHAKQQNIGSNMKGEREKKIGSNVQTKLVNMGSTMHVEVDEHGGTACNELNEHRGACHSRGGTTDTEPISNVRTEETVQNYCDGTKQKILIPIKNNAARNVRLVKRTSKMQIESAGKVKRKKKLKPIETIDSVKEQSKAAAPATSDTYLKMHSKRIQIIKTSLPRTVDNLLRQPCDEHHLGDNASIDVNAMDLYSRIALQRVLDSAIRLDHPSLIDYILKHHPDININEIDENGEMPLLVSVANNKLKSMEALLNNGADINCTDVYDGRNPMQTAALLGYEQAVRLLKRHGADVNACHPVNGQTALMDAAKMDRSTMVELLLSLGVDKHKLDNEKKTALHHAKVKRCQKSVKTLIGKSYRNKKQKTYLCKTRTSKN